MSDSEIGKIFLTRAELDDWDARLFDALAENERLWEALEAIKEYADQGEVQLIWEAANAALAQSKPSEGEVG